MIRVTAPKEILEQYDRVWVPHPGPQTELLRRPETEILYGGARGGGKSDGGRVWIASDVDNPLYRGLVIRKNVNDLADWVDKAKYWYEPMGATFAYQPTVITWPSGAKIITGHLKDTDAYTKYQGQEFQKMLIEEATQIPDVMRYVQLIGSCRSTVQGIRPQILLTANPGNIGHQWVKERFIDPSPPGTPFKDGRGRSFIFIPSTIDDNPTLTKNDPGYVQYLDSIRETDENLWRAWRHGDWSIFVGQVFAKFRPSTHVIPRMPVPMSQCRKIVGFDWGYNAPGSASFIAVTPRNRWGVSHYYKYREVYMTQRDPDEWALVLKDYFDVDGIDWMVFPHDCYSNAQGHRSIEEVFKDRMPGVRFIRGKTLSKGARHQRVAIMQQMLGTDDNEPEGIATPRFQILARCVETIRTLPNLVYDEKDIEDIDTDGEDHIFDSDSLALMTDVQNGSGGAVVGGQKKKRHPLISENKAWTMDEGGEIRTKDVVASFEKALQRKR